MIGRNELCPCGSGKKYKKCCLQKDEAMQIARNKTINAKNKYSSLFNKIEEYSQLNNLRESYDKEKSVFYVGDNSKYNEIFDSYYLFDANINEKTIIENYIENNKFTMNTSEESISESILKSYVSIYQIKDKDINKVLVNDCITGENIYTDDIDIFSKFENNDYIIGRVVNVEGVKIFINSIFKISNEEKETLVSDIEENYLEENQKYRNIKDYLLQNTKFVYKSIPDIFNENQHFIISNTNKVNNKDNNSEGEEAKIYDMLVTNIEEEYIDKCLEVWERFKFLHESFKGSQNGWAAAIEYYVKKDAGANITQAQISKKYEISSRTLGKRYKELKVS